MDWLLCFVGLYFGERLVDFHDLDLIAQPGPAAEHGGVFLGGAAGGFGTPGAEENIVRFGIAVEQIAAVFFRGDNRSEFSKSLERSRLHVRYRFPNCDRKDLL